MKRLLNLFLFSTLLLDAATAFADVRVSARHLIILREGLDSIWGSYVFAVVNDGQSPAAFKTGVVLPKETADWAPQEGIEPENVKLADGGGGLVVEKEFPPGTHVITIGFKVPASLGRAEMTLRPLTTIEELTVLKPRASKISIEASWLKPVDASNSPDPEYDALLADGALEAGSEKVIALVGLPEGRARYWFLGGGVAFLLLVGATILAIKTRPRLSGDGAEAVLLG